MASARKFFFVIYIMICLSGLTWQILNASFAYFKFEVVSTIKYQMPLVEKPRALNFCLVAMTAANETCVMQAMKSDNTSYSNLNNYYPSYRADYMKVQYLMDCSPKWKDMHPTTHGFDWDVEKYFINFRLCYHIKMKKRDIVKNLTSKGSFSPYVNFHYPDSDQFLVFLNSRDKLPWNEYLENYDRPIKANVTMLRFNSYSIIVKRIKWPYADDCYDYHNFTDKNDAIANCVKIKSAVVNRSSSVKIWRENETSLTLSDAQISSQFYKNCSKNFQKPECYLETIVTKNRIAYETKNKLKFVSLHHEFSQTPSIELESQPLMIFVDFVNLILGALGSWIGFSFLTHNPFKEKPVSVSPSSSSKQEDSQINASIERDKVRKITLENKVLAEKLSKLEILFEEQNVKFHEIFLRNNLELS